MIRRMKVVKCPSNILALKNQLIVNPADFDQDVKYVELSSESGRKIILSVYKVDKSEMAKEQVGIPRVIRKFLKLSIFEMIEVAPCRLNPSSRRINAASLEVEGMPKKAMTQDLFDPDELAKEFAVQFDGMPLTVGQMLVIKFQGKEYLKLTVKTLQDTNAGAHYEQFGILLVDCNVKIQFSCFEASMRQPDQFSKARQASINPQKRINLPNDQERTLFFYKVTEKISDKIAKDLDIEEIVAKTTNFTELELNALIRDSLSRAMSRLVKIESKIHVDPKAMEKLKVTRADILDALENDFKPEFGVDIEKLMGMMRHGIINWGPPVAELLEGGLLSVQQAKAVEGSGLVSVLIKGAPNSGKSALAARLAKMSDFPFVKVCSPEDMVGFTESAKCLHIRKIFDDAYRSTLSCIVVDNVEGLLDYGSIGPQYSQLVLQTLLNQLKNQPPKHCKLLVLCTCNRNVLEELGIMSVFSSVIKVPNLSTAEQLIFALKEGHRFDSEELKTIADGLRGIPICIGIKRLLEFAAMVYRLKPGWRAAEFIKILRDFMEVAITEKEN